MSGRGFTLGYKTGAGLGSKYTAADRLVLLIKREVPE
jgi:hypothetical protein